MLDFEDGVSQYPILVFRLNLTNIEGITRAICYFVLEDID